MLVSSRTTNILLVLVLAAGIGIVAMLATRGSAGPIDPPGAPSATLPQVEPRMPIPPVGWNGTFPITISQPGAYFLTRNLETPGAGTNGIVVTTAGVTLDLGDFQISGDDNTGTGISGTANGVKVTGGRIVDFAHGIQLSGSRIVVSGVRVNNYGLGQGIGVGSQSLVEGCIVGNGRTGVSLGNFSVARDCLISEVEFNGIITGSRNTVEGNTIVLSGSAVGTYGIMVLGTDATIRDNTLGNGPRDIGVGAHGAVIIDNVIHCETSIVNLGAFSYTAPITGHPHANQAAYAAGFC